MDSQDAEFTAHEISIQVSSNDSEFLIDINSDDEDLNINDEIFQDSQSEMSDSHYHIDPIHQIQHLPQLPSTNSVQAPIPSGNQPHRTNNNRRSKRHRKYTG